MNAIDEQTKNKIIGVILALVPNAKIYLFGSRARGTQSTSSDIDLAVDAGKPLDFATYLELKAVLAEVDVPGVLDIVDFHRVEKGMQEEIMKESIVWRE